MIISLFIVLFVAETIPPQASYGSKGEGKRNFCLLTLRMKDEALIDNNLE
jgi:hypothetical protein